MKRKNNAFIRRKAECYRLEVYVPLTHLEALKTALFASGAGCLGKYEHCCWVSTGRGQFRALPGAHPYIGTPGESADEVVEEAKIEVLCPAHCLRSVLQALRNAHPYETPAFQYWAVETGMVE